MFPNSIDTKPFIKDSKGNTIKDLAAPFFAKSAGVINDYTLKRIGKHFKMRPDLVALAEYGNTDDTELILKFTGVSNPFTINEDDIMFIPNETRAKEMLSVNHPDEDPNYKSNTEVLIQNFFKYVNTDYTPDFSSYEAIANLSLPSGDAKPTDSPTIPYISEEGEAVTVRNGRLYFGENAGLRTTAQIDSETLTTSGIDEAIRQVVNSTISALDSRCLYNGTKVTDLQEANYIL